MRLPLLQLHALVVDPTKIRQTLESPINERVPGRTLHIVYADVWPPAVTPSPVNPRAAGDRTFPAGSLSAASFNNVQRFRRPLIAARTDDRGFPALTLDVDDPLHLKDGLQTSIDVLMSTAEKLLESLPIQGVMKPILVAPMRIVHRDGVTQDLTIATTPEGSSARLLLGGIGVRKPTMFMN